MISTSLKSLNAVICGASSGIGRETALAMACQGANLFLISRSQDRLKELVSECSNYGVRATFCVTDLEKEEDVINAANDALEYFSEVHILVNNSGGPPSGMLLDATLQDFLAPMSRHLFAAHLLCQKFVPLMEEASYGRILNIISTSVKEPIPGLGVSNTVRGSVAAWAKTLSKELPANITINNLLPGYTDTDRLSSLKKNVAIKKGVSEDDIASEWLASIPAQRLGDPKELASLAAYLASPAGGYIRGQSIAVDGGRLNSI